MKQNSTHQSLNILPAVNSDGGMFENGIVTKFDSIPMLAAFVSFKNKNTWIPLYF